ncbi:DoxX family protein [Halapricum salinum]|uniref:DoxX family membrane protein n=1 Tax=Halapricum salinum TaxID=1457250 RepID=A0A4D6H7I4_9EURY|nr:DoxX family membrane protein [Halapricum salinum]
MGFAYVLAGVAHFLSPSMFARIVPPQLPRPRALVYLSGIAEIVLGVGVLFERTRNVSAWGIVALLVAVFPANVYMATSDELDLPGPVGNVSDAALWARLPLQAVLVAWALWYTNRPQSTAARDE